MKKIYKILLDKNVVKFLHKLNKTDKNQAKILLKSINEIKNNPYKYKQLTGRFKGTRRKRQGIYRIIFDIDDEKNQIIILNLDKRGNIYKKR